MMITPAKLLARNTFFSFLTFGLRFLINGYLIFRIAQVLGVEKFGVFTYSQSFAGVFAVLADFGLANFLIREIATKNAYYIRHFRAILWVKVGLSIITMATIFVLALTFSLQQLVLETILFLSAAMITNHFIMLYTALFRGKERLEYETLITFINLSILFVIVFIALYFSEDVVLIAQLYFISRFIALIFAIIFSRQIDQLYESKYFSFGFVFSLLKRAFPYGVQIFFGLLYFQIDTIMLERLRGVYEVGVYQFAYRIVYILLLITDIVQNSFYPTLSRLYKDSNPVMLETAARMAKYLMIIGIPAWLLMVVLAKEIVTYMGGALYGAAGTVLQLIASLIFIRYWATSLALLLTVIGKQKYRMYFTIAAALTNISFNYFLIQSYSYMGAGAANVLTNVILLILLLIYVYKFTGKTLVSLTWLKIFIVAGLLLLQLHIVNELDLLLKLMFSGLSWAILSYYIVLDDNEKRQVITMARNIRGGHHRK